MVATPVVARGRLPHRLVPTVVAGEVRSLAKQSAEAVKQTTSLIAESVRSVDAGVASGHRVGESFRGVAEQIERSGTMIHEIAEIPAEQVDAVRTVLVSTDHIAGVTRRATEHAEMSASTARPLTSQANDLREVLGTFRLTAHSANCSAPQQPEAPVLTASSDLPLNAATGAVPIPWTAPV